MRKKIVAGNWKMYGNKSFARDLLSEIKQNSDGIPGVELVVFPPFVFLGEANHLLKGSKIKWGAQNVYPAIEGAYTGEISVSMLQELHCDYVLVGHSERRHILGESNEFVAEKFICAGKKGITPILCVGETQKQREANLTFEVIKEQLSSLLRSEEGLTIFQNAVIAYEPVWAIGTGLTATPEQAQEVHDFIRQEVTIFDKTLAEKVCILYGGSVKTNNAAALFSMPDIDGGLIGGASLNAKEFLEIAKLCNC
ncbi:MAG: triose-phosphate isomerase [Gammaproteobacteria bacterium]|nr:triose-phosphate isomerase [Gammaproteobacteria bacterium]